MNETTIYIGSENINWDCPYLRDRGHRGQTGMPKCLHPYIFDKHGKHKDWLTSCCEGYVELDKLMPEVHHDNKLLRFKDLINKVKINPLVICNETL